MQVLAQQLNLPSKDLDVYFTEKLNISIESYVQEHGWQAFRTKETALLQEVTELYYPQSVLISTGGGVILAQENRTYMQTHGKVIYLQVPAELLVTRLRKDPKVLQRPALTELSLEQEVKQILMAREPLYLEMADQVVSAEEPLPMVVQACLTLCKKWLA